MRFQWVFIWQLVQVVLVLVQYLFVIVLFKKIIYIFVFVVELVFFIYKFLSVIWVLDNLIVSRSRVFLQDFIVVFLCFVLVFQIGISQVEVVLVIQFVDVFWEMFIELFQNVYIFFIIFQVVVVEVVEFKYGFFDFQMGGFCIVIVFWYICQNFIDLFLCKQVYIYDFYFFIFGEVCVSMVFLVLVIF